MSNPNQWERGDILVCDIPNAATMTILGGPNYIQGASLWTIRWNEDATYQALDPFGGGWITKVRKAGETRVFTAFSLHNDGYRKQGQNPEIVPYANVITNWCPNCEIDDMIFYSEDYICAWCREMLEE